MIARLCRMVCLAAAAAATPPSDLVDQGEFDPRLKGLLAPPGVRVELAAVEPVLNSPVVFCIADDGAVWVIEWRPEADFSIKVLRDTDSDGVLDSSALFTRDLVLPGGLALRDGWVYVTSGESVLRIRNEGGRPGKREELIRGFRNNASHHRVSGLVFGPDQRLYVSFGDADARLESQSRQRLDVLRTGGVLRCKPDGTEMEAFAIGFRNPWGNVCFTEAGHAFHTDNDADGAPGFVYCRLVHLVEGGDYGWRTRPGAVCCTPDPDRAAWNGEKPGRLPYLHDTGRGAPAGMCVYEGEAFPERFRGLLIQPDVFRKLVRGYRVRPRGASFEMLEEVELLKSEDGIFRPCDAEVGPDGAIYVLDWAKDSPGGSQRSGDGLHGRLYRLSWRGRDVEPALPLKPGSFRRLQGLSSGDLIAALSTRDGGERRAIVREIMTRGEAGNTLQPSLLQLLGTRDAPVPARLAALSALQGSWSGAVREACVALIDDAAADVRRSVLLAAALTSQGVNGSVDAALIRRGMDGDMTVRRAAAIALARRCGPAAAGPLVESWSRLRQGADPFLASGVTHALELTGTAGVAALRAQLEQGTADLQEAAVHALASLHGQEAQKALLDAATGVSRLSPALRAACFRALPSFAEPPDASSIAAWLLSHAAGPPEARAAAMDALAISGPSARAAASPAIKTALGDAVQDVRIAALRLAGRVEAVELASGLARAAMDAGRPAAERREALRAIAGFGPALRSKRPWDGDLTTDLTTSYGTAADPGLRAEILGTIAALDSTRAAPLAEAALQLDEEEVVVEAIDVLAAREASARRLAAALASGRVARRYASRAVDALRGYKQPDIRGTVDGVLKAEWLSGGPGEALLRIRDAVTRLGLAERGKKLWLDPAGAGCSRCHVLEGTGTAVGPDLTRAWETLTLDKLLESILEPSKEIKEGYPSFTVVTRDGRVLTGLLVSETAEELVVKDTAGKEVRTAALDVALKERDERSLMPEGSASHLSLEELADLLAFLQSRGAQESLRAGGR